jgi:predicted lactoylglutathione lyase
MNKKIFINFPVKDLDVTEKFYTALGFTKNSMFSNTDAVSMEWSEDITFMF